MRWLLFLSRLAFICGICILLSLTLLRWEWTKDQDLTATIIVVGFFIGLLVIPITLLIYLGVLIFRKSLAGIVPLWLVVGNVICLILLLFYIISINNGQSNYTP
ncbi:MAG TPA: hypothetical protein VFX58_14185 [Chitinophagaceae bacterium]|nr:hypothetical protein [Chitinophagaceae bacterium]